MIGCKGIKRDILKNKRGDERVMGIWWFLFVAISVGGISIGTLIFYGSSIDVNSLEAEILSEKIFDCVTKNGVVKDSVIEEEFSNIYSYCNINPDLFQPSGEFYVEINLTSSREEKGDEGSEDIENNVITEFSSEKNSLKKECSIKSEIGEAEHYADCVVKQEEIFYYNPSESFNELKKGSLNIIVASDSKGEKIKSY